MMSLNTLATLLMQTVVTQTEAAKPSALGPLDGLLGLSPYLLMFGVIYFLLFRPAGKQRKEHQDLLNSLKKDDEVATSGGIYGRILGIDDKIVTLEIADKVKIRILRDRIAGRWNPGSPSAPAQK